MSDKEQLIDYAPELDPSFVCWAEPPRSDGQPRAYCLRNLENHVDYLHGLKVYSSVQEMFDAIPRDENGVGHPPQFSGDASKLIRLADLVQSPDSPDTNMTPSSDK